jgi:ribonuclease HI
MSSYLTVFTDGACSNNGKPSAKAGIGVYFGEEDIRNVSKRVTGKQSNNTAELSAVLEVFKVLKEEIDAKEGIIIYSDSEYTINCCGSYGEKCKKKDWKNKKGYIPNYELVSELYELFLENPNVIINHVKAHTGLSDGLSMGNEGADRLANEAIGLTSCPYENKKQKYYLNVPYADKEKAKSLGSKWDPKKKKWYYEGNDNNLIKLQEMFSS